jgi:transposase
VDTKNSKIVYNATGEEEHMAKDQRTYTREFKIEAVRLLESTGKSQAEVERELGIGSSNLSRWKKQYGEQGEEAFPGRGRLTPEEERIRRLERENEILRQERDILKKAVAIFSKPSK